LRERIVYLANEVLDRAADDINFAIVSKNVYRSLKSCLVREDEIVVAEQDIFRFDFSYRCVSCNPDSGVFSDIDNFCAGVLVECMKMMVGFVLIADDDGDCRKFPRTLLMNR
jgi:hypothetical protein